jgi:hypothetical protein
VESLWPCSGGSTRYVSQSPDASVPQCADNSLAPGWMVATSTEGKASPIGARHRSQRWRQARYDVPGLPPVSREMRAAKRKRPLRRERTPPAPGVDLGGLAARARYEGSPEHKSYPSPAGPPRLRSDATPCPPDLKDLEQLTAWLQEAIAGGQVGAPWESDFPQYAWIRRGNRCFEARLSNRVLGTYHGYPLRPDEIPQWL